MSYPVDIAMQRDTPLDKTVVSKYFFFSDNLNMTNML